MFDAYHDVDDDDESVEGNGANGYCHFNDDGSKTTFSITLFGHDLSIHQDPSNRDIGHGSVVWDAAVVFAKFMEFNCRMFPAESLNEKFVVELGSGCGLAGIAFMMKGAKVCMTDLNAVTERLTSVNANHLFSQLTSLGTGSLPNRIHRPVVHPLDWTDWDAFESTCEYGGTSFDIVLLTDCVFSVSLAPYLVDCIRKFSSNHTVVYCCHEIRDAEANSMFLTEFGKYFSYKKIPKSKLHPEFRNDLIEMVVGKLLRKSKKNVDKLVN